MGVIVPIALAFFLQLDRWSEILTASAITFLAWGVADLAADILIRPRLADRSPQRALRELDLDRDDDRELKIEN